MKRRWEIDELIEFFTFIPNEYQQIGNKSNETRLGFAIMFKFFQSEARFPQTKSEIPSSVIDYISKQVKVPGKLFEKYDIASRTYFNHKVQIRNFFAFREATDDDINKITEYFKNKFYEDLNPDILKSEILKEFRERRIEPTTYDRIDRMIKSIIFYHENQLFQNIYKKLSHNAIKKMDELISELINYDESDFSYTNDTESANFNDLRSDPGRISLKSVLKEIKKLDTIRQLELPDDLFLHVPQKIVKTYKQRTISEKISELRRHPEHIRYSILAAFFWFRSREITDNLVELLIQIIHRIGVRAERKVDKEILKDFKRINGKTNLLFKIADVAISNPDGIIKDTLYPVVSKNTLHSLVKEYKNTGVAYKEKVYTVMRASYSHHYRRMIPKILDILKFCSNNSIHRPVINALELIKNYSEASSHYFSDKEEIPIDGVIKASMKEAIMETDDKGQERINRINYEIVTLQSLRDKLRCKEIWVVGANRYRNPDEDLPPDFEERREENYKALKQPLNPEEFITGIKKNMIDSLNMLNSGIPKNEKVKVTSKGKNSWICVTPFDPQPEPLNITRLKTEILRQWPMTNLLDIFKETDLRLGFTDCFKTLASYERLDRVVIQKRLILALFGLGTNAGLKRISAGNHGESYSDLLYIRRKFINKDNLRNAISLIINETLKARIHEIWGEGTTTCASDAKKFGAWDQNLMTEWSIRYRGRGIMIYWHVEKKSICIYSQLKTCSSSEVAAMIEGLLKHCTDMTIEKNFVDSKGQSEVAFGFCHLLGFNLMPRLKNIGKQKLYRPDTGMNSEYQNLQPIMTRAINWELIRQQYDQMIKYATALRLGTAETESILKRFQKNNEIKHPTYLAFCELGKAIKTIFLCKYLHSEKLRIEINEGLNVIENWNSANSFIFYGKGGEIATNKLEDQEVAILSLQLLQNCLIYINTLMIQRVLSENTWFNLMTPEDFRALTPLFYLHVNPYGNFNLDMNERINIDVFHNMVAAFQ